MGASKEMIFSALDADQLREWVYEKVMENEENDVAERLVELETQSKELFFKHQNLAQTLLMVTHVIRSYGFCNPDVQIARLDPDKIADGERIINEAFSVVDTPLLGRNVSFLVEHVLRGRYDELAKRLGWEKGE